MDENENVPDVKHPHRKERVLLIAHVLTGFLLITKGVHELSAVDTSPVLVALTFGGGAPAPSKQLHPMQRRRRSHVKVGSASAFRGLAIFLVVFTALLVLKRAGMPDVTGLVWWVFVLGAPGYLAWKGWSCGPGGRGAVLPAKLWRWMLGEDDAKR